MICLCGQLAKCGWQQVIAYTPLFHINWFCLQHFHQVTRHQELCSLVCQHADDAAVITSVVIDQWNSYSPVLANTTAITPMEVTAMITAAKPLSSSVYMVIINSSVLESNRLTDSFYINSGASAHLIPLKDILCDCCHSENLWDRGGMSTWRRVVGAAGLVQGSVCCCQQGQ